MAESNVIAFPGRDFDPTDPRHVERWLACIPPASTVNQRDIGAFLIRTRGGMSINFRVTRAAIEKIAGSAEESTAMLAQRHFGQIEEQCRALYDRTPAAPITGWVLDASDLI